jgi:hypothetical protein
MDMANYWRGVEMIQNSLFHPSLTYFLSACIVLFVSTAASVFILYAACLVVRLVACYIIEMIDNLVQVFTTGHSRRGRSVSDWHYYSAY